MVLIGMDIQNHSIEDISKNMEFKVVYMYNLNILSTHHTKFKGCLILNHTLLFPSTKVRVVLAQ